jgi:hypothetical protein
MSIGTRHRPILSFHLFHRPSRIFIPAASAKILLQPGTHSKFELGQHRYLQYLFLTSSSYECYADAQI